MAAHRPFTVWHPKLELPEGQGSIVLAVEDGKLLVPKGPFPAELLWLPAEECRMTAAYFDDYERWSEAFRRPAHDHA